MMRVLFIDQNSSLGGGQRVLCDLISFSKTNFGINPFLLIPSSGFVTKFAESEGVEFSLIPLKEMSAGKKRFSEKANYLLDTLHCAEKIEEFIDLWRIDLVFANGPRIYLPSTIGAKKFSLKVHLQLHLLFERGIEKSLIETLLKSETVKSAVCCSQKVFEPFKDVYPQKMEVVPYWVSPKFLLMESKRDILRQKFNLGKETIAIGCIGRISKTKGQKFLLNSILPLLGENKNLVLIFAGGSDFENPQEEIELKKIAEESECKERIKFCGPIEGDEFYDALDMLVAPSLWEEPFGLVAVEGMARKLPVVVTKSGALQEIVIDGKTGYVVNKNERELKDKIKELIESKEKRIEFGKNGYERVLSEFHPEKQMRKVMEIALQNG